MSTVHQFSSLCNLFKSVRSMLSSYSDKYIQSGKLASNR